MSKPAERVLVFGDEMCIFPPVVRSRDRAGKEMHAAPSNWHSPVLQPALACAAHRSPRHSDDPRAGRASVPRAS